jgi:hypothetical protein
VLVFVNSQQKCSKLYQDLLHYGYANLMLHGDMPQARCCLYSGVSIAVNISYCKGSNRSLLPSMLCWRWPRMTEPCLCRQCRKQGSCEQGVA